MEVHEREVETLHQWAAEKFRSTKNPRYHVAPQQWVDRALLGEALSDTFAGLVAELQQLKATVKLVAADVINIVQVSQGKYTTICAEQAPENTVTADFVFLCTGHTSNIPGPGTLAQEMRKLSLATPSFKYVHSVYPVEKITKDVVPPDSTLACFGMGLAAIDCINWLTSGRGGYFVADRNSNKLKYVASGFEPRKIYPISESGLFAGARAYNEKENVEGRRHVGIVFNQITFESLRKVTPNREIGRHLIEGEVIPLLALEMMMLYYRTLLSVDVVLPIEGGVKRLLECHIANCSSGSDTASLWHVYQLSQAEYQHFLCCINEFLTSSEEMNPRLGFRERKAIAQFIKVRLGSKADDLLLVKTNAEFLKEAKLLNRGASPWGHDDSILQHVFEWSDILDPLSKFCRESDDLHAMAVLWLEKDILNASQGNLSNPVKAAIDGAIRDLRPCFRDQVEWGAGGPEGTRELFSKWYRATNRLAVGTSLDLMKKILALTDAGIVDLSFCRSPVKEVRGDALHLKLGDRASFASIALNAVVHRFNLPLTDSELYRNLRSQGIIREWSVSDGVESYSPGSLDVDRDSRLVIARNGVTLPNIAALGSMVDGQYYYRLALSRPYVADTILFDADQALSSAIAHWSSLDRRLAA